MESVTKLLERLQASTDPFEALIKEKSVYVKTFGSRWSNRILINEYICLELAKALGLTIPDGGLCIINEKTDIENVIDDIDYDENITGVGFYSEKIYNVSPSINSLSVVNNIINKEEINTIILFDHLVYNVDRHRGNLLLNYKSGLNGFKMYIIDHSHVFNLQHNWDANGLQKLINNKDYRDHKILDLNYKEVYQYFYELEILNENLLRIAASNFKTIVTENLLDNIIDNIPKVWIINEADLLKLKEYILYRLNNIDYIVEMIIKYEKCLGGV
ncbi:HipA domain-containing protein [Clostridium botulinum]|uniref:HipA family kinase n=1 Tax=Clostridium botulinum TaxID=1491 RepID=UPI000772DBB7|nr:HipA family kinase [Clostridium botulinum]NFL86217.1 HipA domain-containing protein [Clostridium botulinum]NFO19708.1 HipA domain-containing protein [Clostridium botulinum]